MSNDFFYQMNKRLQQVVDAPKSVHQNLNEGAVAEASYSAKAARAGKDIGKPGKQFAKIAKSAGERYGSKERGEKVAGAVLAKLRAKEDVAQEGNKFTGNLMKARAAGLEKADLDGDGDMERVRESAMTVVAKSTTNGRTARILHDQEYDEYTISLIGGDKPQYVFAEDRDTAQEIADTWLAEGKTLWPGTAEYKARFGDEMRAGEKRKSSTGGEIEKTATGIRHTARAYDDDAEDSKADDGAPKRRGRPKGSKRALGAKGPTGRSKLLKGKAIREQGIEEDYDSDEYDQEGEMAKSQAHTIVDAAKELHDMVTTNENLPEWVQKKIALAQEYIDSARDYLKANRPEAEMDESALQAYLGKKKYGEKGMKALQQAGREGASKEKMAKIRAQHDQLDEVDLEEKAVSRAQQRFMGMAHAMQKGEKIPGASKELKSVAKSMKKGDVEDFAKTKHKGLPEKKKKKEESVEETTTAGSVATAPAAAPKGKKGMIFGKGVYEAKLQEGFQSRLEKMLTEGMSVNMSVNQDGTKSLSVNATDEDADKLAQIIQLAGMQQGTDYQEACPACGQAPCGCEELEEADLANSPEPEYSDTDTMVNTLSGGLNARKSTGQTTMPVINRDPARQGVQAVSEKIQEQAEQRLWDLYKRYESK